MDTISKLLLANLNAKLFCRIPLKVWQMELSQQSFILSYQILKHFASFHLRTNDVVDEVSFKERNESTWLSG